MDFLRAAILCFASAIASSHLLKLLSLFLLKFLDTVLCTVLFSFLLEDAMSRDYWKEVLGTARKTLAELRVKRDELDAEREEVNLEIVQLEQVVSNLTPLVSESQVEKIIAYRLPTDIKLTDACREILKKNDKHMTPIEIRSALEGGGYDLTQHANALASIHGVLKRLAESGEVESITHDIRGTMYRWKQGTRILGSAPGSSSTPAKRGIGGDPQPAYPPGSLGELARPSRLSALQQAALDALKKSEEKK
jgi:hypothetical protein